MAITEQKKYDIVIVGAGPVGLLLAVCLRRLGFHLKIIDKRLTRTLVGRADGIQPRSLDLLRGLGLKSRIMALAPATVYEASFWDPLLEGKGIRRTSNAKTCPSFIDARYPFTTMLHQGLIEGVLISELESTGIQVQRPWTIVDFEKDGENEDYPVKTVVKHTESDEQEVVRSKYLFSGEGAKSFIRDRLGIKVQHRDPVTNVWGVMDGVVQTNFPDIEVCEGRTHFQIKVDASP